MSISRGMDKEDVELTYNGILLGHLKKKIMPFAATWMDLEVVILSEVGQRKTNIMATSLYMWNQKNGASELIYITEIESQV